MPYSWKKGKIKQYCYYCYWEVGCFHFYLVCLFSFFFARSKQACHSVTNVLWRCSITCLNCKVIFDKWHVCVLSIFLIAFFRIAWLVQTSIETPTMFESFPSKFENFRLPRASPAAVTIQTTQRCFLRKLNEIAVLIIGFELWPLMSNISVSAL